MIGTGQLPVERQSQTCEKAGVAALNKSRSAARRRLNAIVLEFSMFVSKMRRIACPHRGTAVIRLIGYAGKYLICDSRAGYARGKRGSGSSTGVRRIFFQEQVGISDI